MTEMLIEQILVGINTFQAIVLLLLAHWSRRQSGAMDRAELRNGQRPGRRRRDRRHRRLTRGRR